MSTRSNISIELNYKDGEVLESKYATIYCHYDGYIDGVGNILYNHYNTYDEAKELILGGNCSYITETTAAYYALRDGYERNKPKFTEDEPSLMEEFLYVFKDGEWYVSSKYEGETKLSSHFEKRINKVDTQYLELIKDIIDNGTHKITRSGGVTSVFDRTMRFNLNEGFPLLTTKKVFTKGIIHELLWFLKGDTNIKYLVDNNVHIWDGDAYRFYLEKINKHNGLIEGWSVSLNVNAERLLKKHISPLSKEDFIECVKNKKHITIVDDVKVIDYVYGDLGPVYGKQWRYFGNKRVDQVQNIIDKLKNSPDDRRIILSAWNPNDMNEMALPPCHVFSMYYTRELSLKERQDWLNNKNKTNLSLDSAGLDKLNVPKREISCSFTTRSQDVPLGTCYNIASYALLTHMIAQTVNMTVGELIWHGMDCHIYDNQMEGVLEQLSRDPNKYNLPTLVLNPDIQNIDDFKFEDIKIENYESYPSIIFPLSVG